MISLDARLRSSENGQSHQPALSDLFKALANKATDLSRLISRGGELGDAVGDYNADGDSQKSLDVIADAKFLEAVKESGMAAAYVSEEQEGAIILDRDAPLVVAIDPLDGSSNIDVNVSIGTIISVLPNSGVDPHESAMQRGDQQLAAAFFVYGPQTTLYLTTGQGTDFYRMDPARGLFILVESGIKIPVETSEYAINASNARHWLAPVQRYLSDMLLGADGPRDRDFNMRWTASLVADAARIFNRGGIFLYPRDRRSKYENGRLRLIYEANPISLLVEQAGGAATDGVDRILGKQPTDIHERTALVFGSKTEVRWVESYELESQQGLDQSPLFSNRNLFRS